MEFNVVDCFEKDNYIQKFYLDSIKPNSVAWGEKIWRRVSLEDKENQIVFNKNSKCEKVTLFEILKFGFLVKNLNVFSSDNFNNVKNTRLDKKEFYKRIAISDTNHVAVFDSDGNEKKEVVVTNGFLFGSDIKSYLIKENWILNSYSGQMEKKIIAIAPMIYDKVGSKMVPLFWIYYPEWRSLLAAFEAKNYMHDAKISFEDVFSKWYFNSVIVKESNIFDRNINSIKKGSDFNLENELIKEKVRKTEEDLFQH